MPVTRVLVFEKDGRSPLKEWLDELPLPVRAKCYNAILRLSEMGYELARPESAPLRDGIYELRVRRGTVNYRILYFYHGKNVAIVSNGTQKESKVPKTQIDKAVKNKNLVKQNPKKYTKVWEV